MIDSADTTIVTSDLENIEKLMSGLKIVKLQSLLITTSTLFTCNHQISEIIPANDHIYRMVKESNSNIQHCI